MIIGVDAGCLSSKDKKTQVGVYQVVVNFLKEIKSVDKQNTYYLYSFAEIDKDLLKKFGPRVKNIVVKPSKGWTKIWLPLRLLKDKPDIFLGLNQTLPIKLPFQTYKTILLVHDILFDYHPSFYGDSHRLHLETQFAIKHADIIVTVSKSVKKDIMQKYNLDYKKIIIAYEGTRDFPKKRKSESISENWYFLFVGAFKKSKNIPRLIDAFVEFAKKNPKFSLYLVGSDKWLDPKISESLKKSPKEIQKKIYKIGFINDADLAYLYRNAFAFISPSLYEGFGLPFVEAMRYGLPIIGSKAGAIPEIAGSAGILVNPNSTKEIVTALEKLASDKNVYKELSKNSRQRSKLFTWRQFAKIIYSIITSYEYTIR